MNTYLPEKAAKLARDVYTVNNSRQLNIIRTYPEFSNDIKGSVSIDASLGTRAYFIWKKRDQFAVAIRGAGIYKNDLFLIFRGTIASRASDIITDLRIGVNVSSTGSTVHAGFNETFESMKSELGSFIRQQQDVHNIHCIGHSLGGAVANLAADWVANALGKKAKLYTFGAPRVGFGLLGFASRLPIALGNDGIHRVYHNSDPVPMIPLFPYFHASSTNQSYYINVGGVLNFSAHKIDNYVSSVAGKSWQALYQVEPSFAPSSIKQWLQQDSSESLNNPTVWDRLNRSITYIVQSVLAIAQAPVVGGLTVADYLTILLQKGIELAGEAAEWVFLFIQKIMRLLGMKVAETIEELTYQLIRMVLDRITRKIHEEAKKAIDFM